MLETSVALLLALAAPAAPGGARFDAAVEQRAHALEAQVVAWRRDIHEHPELSGQEVRTAKLAADHLRSLGLTVREQVGGTGVVGVLKGGRPGPVVALRADMDALPVAEEVDVPFASKVKATDHGQSVGVMHACGHDAHTAILMGAASVLAGMRDQLPGTVVFLFQPAEEAGGQDEGAEAMIKQGALDDPKPAAIFGLHVMSNEHTGTIDYRPGGIMAAADTFTIKVKGSQTHGAYPWRGVDPVVVAAQIVLGLQTIPSRQMDPTRAPVIVTVGTIHGGVRNNIIPGEVEMVGTLRSLDPEMRKDLHERVRRTATAIAQSAGATAAVEIEDGPGVTYNDPALTERMRGTLARIAGGEDHARLVPPGLVAEDFSAYQARIPGLFVFLGATAPGQDLATAAPNHSPRFNVDENALPLGVRTLVGLALDYLASGGR